MAIAAAYDSAGPALLPERIDAAPQTDKRILVIDFADTARYHAALVAKILELEKSVRATQRDLSGNCGIKVYHVDRWDCAEADFLDARIKALAARVFGVERIHVDLSWASVYRRHDFCMPHSHVRSQASVVYFLDMGEAIDRAKDPIGGRFCFVDPRLDHCCRESGRATRPLFPDVREGSALLFPSELVHTVAPYPGKKPRITLSWNINDAPLPGSPFDGIEVQDSVRQTLARVTAKS